jgi:hypothetical protein
MAITNQCFCYQRVSEVHGIGMWKDMVALEIQVLKQTQKWRVLFLITNLFSPKYAFVSNYKNKLLQILISFY